MLNLRIREHLRIVEACINEGDVNKIFELKKNFKQ